MGIIGLGYPEIVKPLRKLWPEKAKTGRGLFDFGDQRRTAGRSRGFKGHGKAEWTRHIMNPRLQLGEIAPALFVPKFRFLMLKNARENHDGVIPYS